jgi:hypothetical protein
MVAPATSPLVSVRARYGVPRDPNELALEAALAFGLPGAWTDLAPAQVECDGVTGELTFAPNPLGLTFNEVEVS